MVLEDEVETMQAQFMDPDFFKKPADEVRNVQAELDILIAKKDAMYARWEELENMKNGK